MNSARCCSEFNLLLLLLLTQAVEGYCTTCCSLAWLMTARCSLRPASQPTGGTDRPPTLHRSPIRQVAAKTPPMHQFEFIRPQGRTPQANKSFLRQKFPSSPPKLLNPSEASRLLVSLEFKLPRSSFLPLPPAGLAKGVIVPKAGCWSCSDPLLISTQPSDLHR